MRTVIGMDIDDKALTDPLIDEAMVIFADGSLPLPDERDWSARLAFWVGPRTRLEYDILFGTHYFPGQFDSDSLYLFMLNGYGLCGLITYLGMLLVTYNISKHPRKAVVLTFIFVSGLSFNVWEYFPQNAILMLLWGLVMGASAPASTLYRQLTRR